MSRPYRSEKVADLIQADIAHLGPGDWLPSWRELGTTYGVKSPPTMSRVLSILASRGVVEHVPNQGHRIPLPPPLSRAASDQSEVIDGWRGWHAICKAAGKEPWTDSSPRETPIPPAAAMKLSVPVGTVVVERTRTQGWIEGDHHRPVVLSWTWIHPDITRELPILRLPNTGPGGLTSRLEDAGHRIWWEETVTARATDPTESARLEVRPGTPVLDTWRRAWDQHDRVLEVTRRVINSALHELVFRYP